MELIVKARQEKKTYPNNNVRDGFQKEMMTQGSWTHDLSHLWYIMILSVQSPLYDLHPLYILKHLYTK